MLKLLRNIHQGKISKTLRKHKGNAFSNAGTFSLESFSSSWTKDGRRERIGALSSLCHGFSGIHYYVLQLQFKTLYLTKMSCSLYIFLSSTLKNKAKVWLPSEFLILKISLDRSPSFILAKKLNCLSADNCTLSSDSRLKLYRLSAKYKTLELWLFLSFAKSWIGYPHSIPPHPPQQIFSNRLSEDLSIWNYHTDWLPQGPRRH